ncbi:hypothetical protein IQ279_17430 [Streptomyces verrucosisporus]|uniref:hypothetical protein n=1 Tax=Streptomyces verrucosisporus TaxID=1695161 RepID=UPI0019D23C55|nr:hypothetical protein [Streptomyces verrucosisporus]MBN3931390.1 hypothetical protein [Streptomyces verrucosisporus]
MDAGNGSGATASRGGGTDQDGGGPPGARSPRGTGRLLEWIGSLLRRPRRKRGLPLVWLGGEGATAALDSLEKRLGTAGRRQVPHARADTGEPSGADDVRLLLDRLYELLSVRSFGFGHIGFRHYEVLRCLLGPWSGEGGDGHAEITARLRSRRAPAQEGQAADRAGLAGQIGPVWQLVWWLLRQGIPTALFRLAVSGRFPGIGRPYRWFMRQEIPVAEDIGGLPGLRRVDPGLGAQRRAAGGPRQTARPRLPAGPPAGVSPSVLARAVLVADGLPRRAGEGRRAGGRG